MKRHYNASKDTKMTPAEIRRTHREHEEKIKKELEDATYRTKVRVEKSIVDTFIKKNNAVAIKLLFYIARKHDLEEKYLLNVGTIGDKRSIEFKLDIDDILGYCNIDRRTLRDNIKYLTETSIEIVDYKKKSLAYMNILPYAVIKEKKIEITMFQYIVDQVRNVVDQYVTIDTDNLMRLKHKHSLKMIQLLEMIDGFTGDVKKRKKLLLDELNGYFGTKYNSVSELERKILKTVKTELDNLSKLTFEYEKVFEEQKKGRPKLIGLTIVLKDNKQRQTTMF
jgi:hypothetical protein